MTHSPLILTFGGNTPRIAADAFIAPTATIIGDVEIGAGSSVWYGCTVRGDVNRIRIGANTNIQDGSVVHVDAVQHPTIIGSNILIGHLCLIHACVLEDDCFIGMNATVMDGAIVESRAMVAAGALVTPGKRVPAGQLWAGRPASYKRDLSPEEIRMHRVATDLYAGYAQQHKAACAGAVRPDPGTYPSSGF